MTAVGIAMPFTYINTGIATLIGADSDLMRQILDFYADCSANYECSK